MMRISTRQYRLPDIWRNEHVPKMTKEFFGLVSRYYSKKAGSTNRAYYSLGDLAANLNKDEKYGKSILAMYTFAEDVKTIYEPSDVSNTELLLDNIQKYYEQMRGVTRLHRAVTRPHDFHITFTTVESQGPAAHKTGTFQKDGARDAFFIRVNLEKGAKLKNILANRQEWEDRITTTLMHELTHAYTDWMGLTDLSTPEGQAKFNRQTETQQSYRNTPDEATAWTQNLATRLRQFLRTLNSPDRFETNKLVGMFLRYLQNDPVLMRVLDGNRQRYLKIIYNYLEEHKNEL